jgi:hypothetical protein
MIITGAEKETDKNIDYRPPRRAPPPNLSLKFSGRATRGHLFMQPRGLIIGVVNTCCRRGERGKKNKASFTIELDNFEPAKAKGCMCNADTKICFKAFLV